MSLGIGLYWFIISISKEIRHILRIFNDKAAQTNESKEQSNKLRILIELIEAHGTINELS